MANETNNPAIIDVNLSAVHKKKFRIDGDDNRILELNTSDMNIAGRLSETYPKLTALQQRASGMGEDIDENTDTQESLALMAERLHEVDTEMRSLIDYIFDAPVSEVTTPSGTMYDLFNGTFRFEYILTVFIGLYENNLNSEYEKLQKQVNKYTKKYKKR